MFFGFLILEEIKLSSFLYFSKYLDFLRLLLWVSYLLSIDELLDIINVQTV